MVFISQLYFDLRYIRRRWRHRERISHWERNQKHDCLVEGGRGAVYEVWWAAVHYIAGALRGRILDSSGETLIDRGMLICILITVRSQVNALHNTYKNNSMWHPHYAHLSLRCSPMNTSVSWVLFPPPRSLLWIPIFKNPSDRYKSNPSLSK